MYLRESHVRIVQLRIASEAARKQAQVLPRSLACMHALYHLILLYLNDPEFYIYGYYLLA